MQQKLDSSPPFRFTESSVRNAEAPTGARFIRYRDSALQGFGLRVMASGVKTFLVYRRTVTETNVKNRKVSKSAPVELKIGRWPAMTVEQARRLAHEHLGEIEAGRNPQTGKRAIREEKTLGELFSDYLELHAKPRKRTWDEDERRFNGHLSVWKNRRISSIEASDVHDWHAKVGREHGPFAANRVHALLRKVFNFARGRGWKGGNPAVGVQRFPELSRERFLDAIELRMFFSALKAEPEYTARDFFMLALLTGARRANVLAMSWSDIDIKRGLWVIPGEKSKNGTPLVVILAPQVVAILQARKRLTENSPWVLPSGTSKSGHFIEPKSAWKRILVRAELARLVAMIAERQGHTSAQADAALQEAEVAIERARLDAFARRLPKNTNPHSFVLDFYRDQATALGLDVNQARMRDLRIHDLRRTLGSWQAANGSSLPIIGRSLGHKQMQTTAIYARLSLEPVRNSIERAADAMLAVVESPSTFNTFNPFN